LSLAVVKLGGSLSRGGNLRSWLDAVVAVKSPVIVVPGGGAFADGVRQAQADMGFSDALAHRLAIKAMASYGEALTDLNPRFAIAASEREFQAAWARGLTPVWAPLDMVEGRDGIPESWDMTSDSLAAWLAGRLGARLVMVKSVEPPAGGQVAAEDAARRGITDALLPAFLEKAGVEAVWLGPRDWPLLARVIDDNADFGARITARSSVEAD
jgi:5-(aminomethyl)-3-furanmethanol phosphate kinase